MPTITLNKTEFEKAAGKKLPDEKLKDRISMIGTALEGIEGNEIKVEVFPNRPDMLSLPGFARAFSSFIGVKTGLREYHVKPSGEKVIIDKSVGDVRPYTACAIVKGIKYDDEKIKEIIDLQEALHITFGRKRKKAAIGIYPCEKIKFPIRFVARKPEEIKFRPLESPREMTGQQILSQHPTGREYGQLLEGMQKYPLFVDANGNILSMPPIINSHDTGKISSETRDVFIECSGFDFNILQKCLNMIVTAMADMGGQICSIELQYPDKKIATPKLEPERMRVDINYVNRILGLQLKEKDMKKCLEMMGHGYKKGNTLIPAYRADIMHQIDLVEDIAIAYGYENIKPEIPKVATTGEESRPDILKGIIRQILSGLGMTEAVTYNLTNKDNQNRKMNSKTNVIELLNSVSQGYDTLRAWLLPSLMETLAGNKHHEYPQKIFGFGTAFTKDAKEETGIKETEKLAIAICHEKANYTEAKQAAEYLMRLMGLEFATKETEHTSFIKGRTAAVIVKGKEVGILGEINPAVLANWGMEMPVAAAEINAEELFKLLP